MCSLSNLNLISISDFLKNQKSNELNNFNAIDFGHWETKIYQVFSVRNQLECLNYCINIDGLRCGFYVEIEVNCYLGTWNHTNLTSSSNVPISIQSSDQLQIWIRSSECKQRSLTFITPNLGFICN